MPIRVLASLGPLGEKIELSTGGREQNTSRPGIESRNGTLEFGHLTGQRPQHQPGRSDGVPCFGISTGCLEVCDGRIFESRALKDLRLSGHNVHDSCAPTQSRQHFSFELESLAAAASEFASSRKDGQHGWPALQRHRNLMQRVGWSP